MNDNLVDKPRYPDIVYLVWEETGDPSDPYILLVHPSWVDFDDGVIGVYEISGTAKITTTKTLENTS